MEIERPRYIEFAEAVLIHVRVMQLWDETRYGVADRSLIESALARPRQAAAYENADLIRQAATLYLGLIKNHPWVGGNKRTATTIVNIFLERNGMFVTANAEQTLRLVLDIESDQYQVDDIEAWLHQHSIPLP